MRRYSQHDLVQASIDRFFSIVTDAKCPHVMVVKQQCYTFTPQIKGNHWYTYNPCIPHSSATIYDCEVFISPPQLEG